MNRDSVEKSDFALNNPKKQNEIVRDEFKAEFYRSVVKPDSTCKIFPKKVIIKMSDIEELNSIIVEKLTRQYPNAGSYFSAIVNHKNRQTYDITQWEKFRTKEWMDTGAINSIVLTWTFNAILPEHERPQKHTLVIKLSNGLSSKEMLNLIFTGNIENLSEIDSDVFPIIARVDFINKMIGEELLNHIGKWVESLEKTENFKNKTILFLKKHINKVSFLLENISFVVLVLLSTAIISYEIKSLKIIELSKLSTSNLIDIIRVTVLLFTSVSIIRKLIETVSTKISIALESYGKSHVFNITKGDEQELKDIEKSEKGKGYLVMAKLSFAIILNIAGGIFANLICRWGGI